MRPVNPGNDTSRMYAEPFMRADTGWRKLDLESDATSFDMPQTWVRIRAMEKIPHIDAAAVVSDDGGEIVLFAVNRDLSSEQSLSIEGDWLSEAVQSTVRLQAGDSPFLRQEDWYKSTGYHVTDTVLKAAPDGRFELVMPAGAVARITIKLK
jgi:alpha-N-arabinofuranosidase